METNLEARAFEALLDYLHRMRGFDFGGYKRSSLQRRIRKRMQAQSVDSFGDYLDYLEVHPDEFEALFNAILINVTGFFRDPVAFGYFQQEVLPDLLQLKPATEPIRVWSAGCASGEEAYTLAMILAELLGLEGFRQRVKIYATDIDEEALAQARLAKYSASDLESLPAELRERYFEAVGDQFTFHPELRRSVIFGRHNLMKDAPISRLDLLVCRNTLMYFNAEAQRRILSRFHFALRHGGILFLGKAEMLLTHTHLFTPLSLQHRIFAPVSRIPLRDQIAFNPLSPDLEAPDQANFVQLWGATFDTNPVAQLVLDTQGVLILANQLARILFNLNLSDLGRPFQDLEISYRPIDLRSPIQKVFGDSHSITIKQVMCLLPESDPHYFDVQLMPLQNNEQLQGVSITFLEMTDYHQLQQDLERSTHELETANEELQSSNEELETTNEELQSTNEELETTNEELQSTNEELETMNEELQSTNEELQTLNQEMQQSTHDLNQANAFLSSILTSLRAGVVVVDRQFKILSWNQESENLWGLRPKEVEGQSFFGLDIGLPVDQLWDPIRACLAGDPPQEKLMTARNRRGKEFRCRVSISPLVGSDQQQQGAIIMIEEMVGA